ncbi:MAG: UDP-glucose--hexose-1-phosphate uridylyltransferase [Erythrobacter sp.]
MSETDQPHRRLNRLTGQWVLVSPQRMKRPWQGEKKSTGTPTPARHDPACYLCPGNERVGGVRNPDYDGVFAFPNDFPALLADAGARRREGLLREEPATGEAQVICYSPDHSATLASLSEPERREVVDKWCDISRELGRRWAHVEIFENKGTMMGASSPHPHGQVWAGDFIPSLVAQEDSCQRRHLDEHGSALLDDVLVAEEEDGSRVVAANDCWLAVVPHWAAWPFETLVIARGDIRRLEDLDDSARGALASLLGELLRGNDALFDTAFPYSMGWHGAPHGIGEDCAHWRLHAHFYPPLLRSAEIRKHMVGFELLAETQRDLTPEMAAQRLREVMQ